MLKFGKKNLLKTLTLIFLLVITFRPPVDLDLGWHLRNGEYFFKTGAVLRDNILSYVWPNYKWVQTSWGYDLLLYQLFTHFGFLAVSLGAVFITLIIFLVITYPWKKLSGLQFFFLAIIYLSQAVPLYITGLRSQAFSALFLAVTLAISYQILEEGQEKSRLLYALPIIFLIWANLHAGFTLGLIMISVLWFMVGILIFLKSRFTLTYRIISTKKWLVFGVILFLCFLSPIVNPWGFRIYDETFRHVTNLNLTGITEWVPLFFMPNALIIIVTIGIISAFIIFLEKRLRALPSLVILLLSLYLAISAVRFTIALSIVVTFLLAKTIPMFNQKFFHKPAFRAMTFGFLVVLVGFDMFVTKIFFFPPRFDIFKFSWNKYCAETQDCDENITKIMLKNPPIGHGYHFYNYGGYLTWRVRAVKTFIDGRMVAWEDNGKTLPLAAQDGVLQSVGPVVWKSLDSQYNFTWAIVFPNTPISKYLDALVKNGQWKKIYSDELYSYYVKK